MPPLRPAVRGGHRWWCGGGILTYAADRLWEEVAYVAYYLHWPLDDILDLEHAQRDRVIAEINKIHQTINASVY